VADKETTTVEATAASLSIPIDDIDPSPDQPRRLFRDESLEELAQSIRVDGLIQPIVVQRSGARYVLVVGERRWRAAKLAGLTTIPAIVKEIASDRVLEVALVENIQREDLNPIEVAYALNRMLQEFHLSHEELAGRTGKDRTTITNLLRLLKLPGDIRELVADRAISMGHARALLSIDDPEEQRRLAKRVVEQDLSVRQVERLVQDSAAAKKHRTQPPIDPNVAAAIESLERTLGTRVRLVPRGANKGRIEIEYNSAEDLDRIYAAIVE
jgi:ParB family chromosome partitioning protein